MFIAKRAALVILLLTILGSGIALAQPCDLGDIGGDGAFCGDASTGPRDCTDAEWVQVCRDYGRPLYGERQQRQPRQQYQQPQESCYPWHQTVSGRWLLQCITGRSYYCYVCQRAEVTRACTRLNGADRCARESNR